MDLDKIKQIIKKILQKIFYLELLQIRLRAIARSENLGGHVVLGGNNVPPLVEIGLSDPSKTGGARAPPAPPLETGLCIHFLS